MYPVVRMSASERAVARYIIQRLQSVIYRGSSDAYSKNVDQVMEDVFDVPRFVKKLARGLKSEQKLIALFKEVGINELWKMTRSADNFKAFNLLVATDVAINQEKKKVKKYEESGRDSKAAKSKKLLKKYKKSYAAAVKQLRSDLGVKKATSTTLLKEIDKYLDDRQEDDGYFLFDEDYYGSDEDNSVASFLRQSKSSKGKKSNPVFQGAFADELGLNDEDDEDYEGLLDIDGDDEDEDDDDETMSQLVELLKDFNRRLDRVEKKSAYVAPQNYMPQMGQRPTNPEPATRVAPVQEADALGRKIDTLADVVSELVGVLTSDEDEDDPMATAFRPQAGEEFGEFDLPDPGAEIYPRVTPDGVETEINTEEQLRREIFSSEDPPEEKSPGISEVKEPEKPPKQTPPSK